MIGGAGNVAANIVTLGGQAILVGAVGADTAAAKVRNEMAKHGDAMTDALVTAGSSTTTEKTRYIAKDRHLLRADRESNRLEDSDRSNLHTAIKQHAGACDVIVVSDYAKGVVDESLMAMAVEAAAEFSIPLVADPKRRDFTLYRNSDVITPNMKELEFATGEPCDDLDSCRRAARTVFKITGATILLTRSENGVALFEHGNLTFAEDALATSVRDVSGAGDTILAAAAIAIGAGAKPSNAAHVANVAAAVAVGKIGTSIVTADELNLAMLRAPKSGLLEGKLASRDTAERLADTWRADGMVVGFTNGCFDLLHPGHVKLLNEARAACDKLVVGLNTDDSVRRLKGDSRPIQTELARAEVIGALRNVDLVVLFDEDTPIDLIDRLRPDVLCKGADYKLDDVVGADLVASWGGRVELIDLVPDQSSTNLIAASQDPQR